ncbi:MAG: hypothetical protein Q9204_002239 [Flavoplaca sp. TL-2023a]
MVEALCHPSPGTKVQIAMWDASESGGCEVFGDLIGLHYRLDPVILRTIEASCNRAGGRHQSGLDRFAITHAKVGKIAATLLQPKNGANAPPLVLIAGPLSALRSEFDWHPQKLSKSCPPFNKSSGDDKKPFHVAPLRGEYESYLWQLSHLLNKYYGTGKNEIAETFLLCLLPILQLNFLKSRFCLSVSRDTFESSGLLQLDSLYRVHSILRAMINDMGSDWGSIRRYMKSCFNCELSEMRCYQDADDDVKDFVEEASRLEGQVREHLQLQNGIKALEESKKSIEVSNQQIQEGKRLKTCEYLDLGRKLLVPGPPAIRAAVTPVKTYYHHVKRLIILMRV